jgi:hypothetical protein
MFARTILQDGWTLEYWPLSRAFAGFSIQQIYAANFTNDNDFERRLSTGEAKN